MNQFLTRLSSGLVFAAIVIAGLLYNQWTFFFIILAVMLGCLYEYYTVGRSMFRKDDNSAVWYRNLISVFGIWMLISAFLISFGYIGIKNIFMLPIHLLAIFGIELFLETKRPFRNIGINLIALIYIVFPLCLSFIIANFNGEFTGSILLGTIFIIWGNDSGAYIIGSLIGKHKLLPAVSPKKSIEGFIGGGFFCLLVAFLNINIFNQLPFLKDLDLIQPKVWYMIAGGVFLFATMGDLVESLWKRKINVKDSGSIMPGHGGFLDRFDAFLFVLPIVVAIIMIFNHT